MYTLNKENINIPCQMYQDKNVTMKIKYLKITHLIKSLKEQTD